VAKLKKSALVGLYIKAISKMSAAELSARGWHESPAVVTLAGRREDREVRIFPSSDPEMNQPGTIFGDSPRGSFYLFGSAEDQRGFQGLLIRDVRPMTAQELSHQAWDIPSWEKPPFVLVMTGMILFPSRDPEGNGPGIWVVSAKGDEELL